MKKLLKVINLKTIRNQLIAMQILVVIPCLFLLGAVLNNMVSRLLVESNMASYTKILESSSMVLDDQLDYCRDITRSILADSVLQRELVKSNMSEGAGGYMNGNTFQNIDSAMEKYITGFSGAKSIYIYDLSGKLFYIDMTAGSSQVMKALDYSEIQSSEWFKKASESGGYEQFVSFNVITGDSEEISCVKLLKSLETQTDIGMMIVNFNKEFFDRIFPDYESENSIYAVCDERDGGQEFVVLEAPQDITQTQVEEIIGEDNSDYYYTEYENSETGWTLIHIIHQDDILGDALVIRTIVTAGIVLTLVLLLGLTSVICSRITRPLSQLRDNIVRVGEGERYLDDSYPKNEVGELGYEFNRMVNEKLALSDRVARSELKTKEAELELLQSNINPHFLYNTLDSLYWMAVLEDADDIADMTKALSDVFKIALSKGEKYISVEEELQFVKSYLLIQNRRFEGKIHVEIDVDEALLNEKVIKLLLQPFVENAVYHGIEPKIGEGTIWIRIYKQGKFMFFEVEDDGVGMNVEKDIMKGYAVRNSVERIKLVYGAEAGIDFYSKKDKGVRVVIRFPMEGENAESSFD